MKERKNIVINKFKLLDKTYYLRRNLEASWYHPNKNEYYLDLYWDSKDAGSMLCAAGPTMYETKADLAYAFNVVYESYAEEKDIKLAPSGIKVKNYLKLLVDYIKEK